MQFANTFGRIESKWTWEFALIITYRVSLLPCRLLDLCYASLTFNNWVSFPVMLIDSKSFFHVSISHPPVSYAFSSSDAWTRLFCSLQPAPRPVPYTTAHWSKLALRYLFNKQVGMFSIRFLRSYIYASAFLLVPSSSISTLSEWTNTMLQTSWA